MWFLTARLIADNLFPLGETDNHVPIIFGQTLRVIWHSTVALALMSNRAFREDQDVLVLRHGLIFSVGEASLALLHPDPFVAKQVARCVDEVSSKRLRREQNDRMVGLDDAPVMRPQRAKIDWPIPP